jgi:hypothetical protein
LNHVYEITAEDRALLNLKTVNGNIFLLWLENGVVEKVYNRYSVLDVNHVKEWLNDERDSRFLISVGEKLPQVSLLRNDVKGALVITKPTMLVINNLESELQRFIEWLNMARDLFPEVDIIPVFTRNTEQMMKKNELVEQYPDLLNIEYIAQYNNLKKQNLEWMQIWPELLSAFDDFTYYIDVDLQLQGVLGETPLIVILNAEGELIERWQCLGYSGEDTEKSEQLIVKMRSVIEKFE